MTRANEDTGETCNGRVGNRTGRATTRTLVAGGLLLVGLAGLAGCEGFGASEENAAYSQDPDSGMPASGDGDTGDGDTGDGDTGDGDTGDGDTGDGDTAAGPKTGGPEDSAECTSSAGCADGLECEAGECVFVPPARVPTATVQTAGGGTTSGGGLRLHLRIGAPQPMGQMSGSGHRLTLGPFAAGS